MRHPKLLFRCFTALPLSNSEWKSAETLSACAANNNNVCDEPNVYIILCLVDGAPYARCFVLLMFKSIQMTHIAIRQLQTSCRLFHRTRRKKYCEVSNGRYEWMSNGLTATAIDAQVFSCRERKRKFDFTPTSQLFVHVQVSSFATNSTTHWMWRRSLNAKWFHIFHKYSDYMTQQ